MVGEGTKRFQHPGVGAMELDYEEMELANSDGQRMIAYYAEPGTPDHDALVLLDMAGAALVEAERDARGSGLVDGSVGGLVDGRGDRRGRGAVGQLPETEDGEFVERRRGPVVPDDQEG